MKDFRYLFSLGYSIVFYGRKSAAENHHVSCYDTAAESSDDEFMDFLTVTPQSPQNK